MKSLLDGPQSVPPLARRGGRLYGRFVGQSESDPGAQSSSINIGDEDRGHDLVESRLDPQEIDQRYLEIARLLEVAVVRRLRVGARE